jgi:hypothetical protein
MRRWITAGATLGALVLGTVGFLVLGRSSWLHESVEARLSEALGRPVELAEATLRPGRLHLSRFHSGGDEESIDLTARDVDVTFSIWPLLLGRPNPIRRVRLDGVEITLRGQGGFAFARQETARSSPRRGTLRRVAWTGVIEIQDARVDVILDDEPVTLLDDFSCVLARTKGASSLRAHGRAGRGSLDCDLNLDPSRGRAAGFLQVERLPLALLIPILPDIGWHRPDRALLHGRVQVETDTAGVHLSGAMRVEDLGLDIERVAERPLTGIDAAASGRVTLAPGRQRLELGNVRLRLAHAYLEVDGTIDRADRDGSLHPFYSRFGADLRIRLPEQPAESLFTSLPRGLLGPFQDVRTEGSLAGELAIHLDPESLEDLRLELTVRDRARIVSAPRLPSPDTYRRAFVHEVDEPRGIMHRFITGPGTEAWVSLSEVSPFLIHAVIAHEDGDFLDHAGFAPWAVETALRRNLEAGRFAYGASTISMQLARNLLLRRDKLLARKLQEVLVTWWLEQNLSKAEILALYLNVIEYGPGLYGIGPACKHYFDRNPAELTISQAAFLACILPSPRRYHTQYNRGRLWPGFAEQMRYLLRHMTDRGRIDERLLAAGIEEIASFAFRDDRPNPRARPKEGTRSSP